MMRNLWRQRERSRSTHRPWARLTALLCVSLYLLASGRALAPELCLTQREIRAAEASISDANLEAGCCTMRKAPVKSAPGSSAPATPTEKKCPLCSLAKAFVQPLEYTQAPAAAEAVFQPFVSPSLPPALPEAPAPHFGRAPPATAAFPV